VLLSTRHVSVINLLIHSVNLLRLAASQSPSTHTPVHHLHHHHSHLPLRYINSHLPYHTIPYHTPSPCHPTLKTYLFHKKNSFQPSDFFQPPTGLIYGWIREYRDNFQDLGLFCSTAFVLVCVVLASLFCCGTCVRLSWFLTSFKCTSNPCYLHLTTDVINSAAWRTCQTTSA